MHGQHRGYTTITSRYGYRVHPVLHTWRLHTGTDIAVPMNSDIIAANDGIVITSSYLTGYGYTIMIDHGGGIVTLYGHASELIAEVRTNCKKGRCYNEIWFNWMVNRSAFTF